MSGNIRRSFPVEVQQVKRDEHALTSAEEQIAEDRPSSTIDVRNLTVDYCTFNVKVFTDPRGEIRKATEDVSVSRNQFTFATLDVSERTKAVDLQFKEKLV
jgi:hypothetical protein